MKRKTITGLVKIDLIKKFMKENKLSIKSFSKDCGIGIGSLRYILSDKCNFCFKNLIKIARVMNIDFRKLLKD